MQRYISILRGINVGGKNKIKMSELREKLAGGQFQNTTTYIQSGNLIFDAPPDRTKAISRALESLITQEFNITPPVITFTMDEYQSILQGNPFTKNKVENLKPFHITFLEDAVPFERLKSLDKIESGKDEYRPSARAIYLKCPDGYGKTKLNNTRLEKLLETTATTRNLKTSMKLLEMAKEI